MSKKKTIELILQTAGFEMKNYGIVRDGSSYVVYRFEGWKNGRCEIDIETDSYESALSDLLSAIYELEDVVFFPIL
jgi:hypothetical protein